MKLNCLIRKTIIVKTKIPSQFAVLLGWLKSLLEFFCNIVWKKTWSNFLANQIFYGSKAENFNWIVVPFMRFLVRKLKNQVKEWNFKVDLNGGDIPQMDIGVLTLNTDVLSRVRLCDPMDCSPPGSSVHGIFQARILEWVAISYSRGSSQPRNWTHVSCASCIGRQILYHCTTSVLTLTDH